MWNKVGINLPGIDVYNFFRKWVYNYSNDGHIAADLFFNLDDGLPVWIMQYLFWGHQGYGARHAHDWGIRMPTVMWNYCCSHRVHGQRH